MGTWSEQQELKKDAKELNKSRKENLGKFFYDLAKLTFAGVVIGGIMQLRSEIFNVETIYTILFGLISTMMIAFWANRIFK